MNSVATAVTGPGQPTYPEGAPGAGSYEVRDASAADLPQIELASSMILLGDASRVLVRLPAASVRCVVTSPPYWGLRDYGIHGQIGLEETLTQYIDGLVGVFREMRRVLKPDGTFWLNIGDGYTSGNRGWRAPDKKNPARAMSVRPDTPAGLKPKDLIGVPWRLALALQDDGWFLRSDIIWHKPNAMPESVKDRPTRCHEYVFLFSKNESYYYNREAIQEDAAAGAGKRNRRTVWSINTEARKEAHFATFPPPLVAPCVLAGSEPGDFVLDPFFGSGTVGAVCQQLQRHFVGIELHPEYVQIAHRRLDSLFSRVAVEPSERATLERGSPATARFFRLSATAAQAGSESNDVRSRVGSLAGARE